MMQPFWFMSSLFLLMIWETVWKGFALWFAGKNEHKGWFIAIFILNTAGILPIIYLLWFRCKNKCCCEDEKKLSLPEKKKVVKKKK
jgi:methionyl-tRNA synthetase